MTETLLVAKMTIKGASYFKTARLIFTPAMLNLKVCVCGGRGAFKLNCLISLFNMPFGLFNSNKIKEFQ